MCMLESLLKNSWLLVVCTSSSTAVTLLMAVKAARKSLEAAVADMHLWLPSLSLAWHFRPSSGSRPVPMELVGAPAVAAGLCQALRLEGAVIGAVNGGGADLEVVLDLLSQPLPSACPSEPTAAAPQPAGNSACT